MKWLRELFRMAPPCDLCGQSTEPIRTVNWENRWADGFYRRTFRACTVCWDKDDFDMQVDALFKRTGKGEWVPHY